MDNHPNGLIGLVSLKMLGSNRARVIRPFPRDFNIFVHSIQGPKSHLRLLNELCDMNIRRNKNEH